jgi:hypothetical protein
VVEKDWTNCKYWDSDAEGPEDITKYDHRTVLFSQGDFMSVYIVGDLTVPGSIWAIYDADTDHYQASPLPISGFPEDIAFHPHGIHIREVASKKLLYVINHAYDRGGDRVEVFKIIAHPETSTLSLEYEYSIDIGPKWLGNLNDLIVPEDDHLLITHYIPYPDAETGYSPYFNFQSSQYLSPCLNQDLPRLGHEVENDACHQLPLQDRKKSSQPSNL